MSWPEALELLSAELGEPVTFHVAAEQQFLERLTGAGVAAGTADLLIAREWAILAGENNYTTDTFQQMTGRPPRTSPSSCTSTAPNSFDPAHDAHPIPEVPLVSMKQLEPTDGPARTAVGHNQSRFRGSHPRARTKASLYPTRGLAPPLRQTQVSDPRDTRGSDSGTPATATIAFTSPALTGA